MTTWTSTGEHLLGANKTALWTVGEENLHEQAE